jgi:hypothetical protein
MFYFILILTVLFISTSKHTLNDNPGGLAVEGQGLQFLIAVFNSTEGRNESLFVFVVCCVGSSLYDELVIRSEKAYKVCV